MGTGMSPRLKTTELKRHLSKLTNHHFIRNVKGALKLMLRERHIRFWFILLLSIVILGIIGPTIAPYEPAETQYDEDGNILFTAPPSAEHPLGTTDKGHDVLSRVLYGARPTVITGAIGGGLVILIGGTVGITAGYVGGRTENVLMRITDLAYGIPLIPTALVIVGLLGVGFLSSILVIGLLVWRGSARVLRAQVLQIKERPYVMAARATGASTPRIIIKHILPNVGTMVILFFSLSIGTVIILQAGLAYLGVSNPTVPAWGNMIRNAQSAGRVSTAIWWSIPPGLLISLTVMASYMFGRGYENVAGSGDDEAMVQAG